MYHSLILAHLIGKSYEVINLQDERNTICSLTVVITRMILYLLHKYKNKCSNFSLIMIKNWLGTKPKCNRGHFFDNKTKFSVMNERPFSNPT